MKIDIGHPIHFRWLRGLIFVIFVLNVLDGILTLYWVFAGKATEANPLMERLLTTHPLLFISVKMLLVLLGSWLLWRLRTRAAAVVSIFMMFLVYYYLLLYHLKAMNLRVVQRLFD